MMTVVIDVQNNGVKVYSNIILSLWWVCTTVQCGFSDGTLWDRYWCRRHL